MLDRSDLDLRYAGHVAKVARANREGWHRRGLISAGTSRPSRGAAVVAWARRHVGGTVVRAGDRLLRMRPRLRFPALGTGPSSAPPK